MVEVIEATRNVALDEPRGSAPSVVNLSQRRMAPPPFSEAVGMVAERRLKVSAQDHSDHFSEQFVRPNGQAERTLFSVLFRDVDASCWLPVIAFISQGFNDRINFLQRHCVYGVLVDSGSESTRVSIDFAVGFEVQVSVEQLSVDTLERQTLFASLMNQFQVNVGVLHCAYLSLVKLYATSPVLLYQGSTLAYFRKLPLRHVSGATVSDYYGGSATLGVAACRPSRVCIYGTLSVGRCHVLCCSHQAHCSRFTGESRSALITPHAYSSVAISGML